MPDAPNARSRTPRPRPERTYVVLACSLPWGRGTVVTPLGTVTARDRRAAEAAGPALAAARLRGAVADIAVRVRRASACRPAWLCEALARDGAWLASRPSGPGGDE